jgi:mRNA-degrading endonuclease RelE of RelBE toxin-antitoxin system
MRFVETPIFTRAILEQLSEDDYRRLQLALLLRPEQGALIRSSRGLRKLRWAATGRGKRSGLRVIYYWHAAEQVIYMLYAYPKNAQENLTPGQLRMLSRLVKEGFR